MGRAEQRNSRGGMLINCLVLIAIVALLAGFALSMMESGLKKYPLLAALSNAKQIYTGVQSAALDYAVTGKGIGWPADKGVKSAHEYVRLLVKESVFRVNDLKVFTTQGLQAATSLETITPEHIGFRIANVSESDPADTIFLVTPNFLDKSPYPFIDSRQWWERLILRTPRREGFVVFRKGGDGNFYNTKPDKFPAEIIGILPPREPKFLDP